MWNKRSINHLAIHENPKQIETLPNTALAPIFNDVRS